MSLAQSEIIIAHLARRMTFVIINYLIKRAAFAAKQHQTNKAGKGKDRAYFKTL